MGQFLIPPASDWKGTVGTIIRPGDFGRYLRSLTFDPGFPQGIVIHNTASPDGAQWDATDRGDDPVADAVQRAKNLTEWFRRAQPGIKPAWHAGPHLFVDDLLAIELTPLTVPGVHSPSWNATHIGIEMVGDFAVEAFDTGRGAKVRDLTVEITAALCKRFGLDPNTRIKFHKEDPRSDHDCPGKNVKKGEFISRVEAVMGGEDVGLGHVVEVPAVPAPAPVVDAVEAAVRLLQTAYTAAGPALGLSYPLKPDGWPGNKTATAAEAFAKKLRELANA